MGDHLGTALVSTLKLGTRVNRIVIVDLSRASRVFLRFSSLQYDPPPPPNSINHDLDRQRYMILYKVVHNHRIVQDPEDLTGSCRTFKTFRIVVIVSLQS